MVKIEEKIGKNKPVLVFGSYKAADEYLKELCDNPKNRQESAYKLDFCSLLVQNYVHGCLMMVNRTLANMMKCSNDKAILMHDWWGALIAAGCGHVEHIDEAMMLYRQHGNNVVGSVNVKSFKYRVKKIFDPKIKESCKLYLEQAKLLNSQFGNCLYNENNRKLDNFIKLYKKNKI